MRAVMNITRALADPNRARAVLALRHGELCVCQITELFGLSPSTVSKHLSILFQAELVESRKEGRWMHYRLPGRDAPVAARAAIDWLTKSLADDPQVVKDSRRLQQIRRLDPAILCKRQCCR
jgi:ArsR family transcriptional regulator, arsenate/arsenite/antimonite-responsive transcriptional repressor